MSALQRQTVAGFIGTEHPAFLVQHRPEYAPRGHVVYLPPLAEEMNRCRAIVGEQARWFASRGLTASILDFYGTGDSPGDLTDASLGKWHTNIDNLIDSLSEASTAPIVLWGCRLGGLIALDYLRRHPGRVDTLLLWQPVTSGKACVSQLLRHRSAGQMDRGAEAETKAEMRAKLSAGENLEVAGYTFGGELTTDLDAIDVEILENVDVKKIFWLEHSSDGDNVMNERSRRAVDTLRKLGPIVDVHYFGGQPLWQLHKRDRCEQLLKQTRSLGI